MTRGRVSRFDNDTIALAMELAAQGVQWKIMERGIGEGIYRAVRDAKRHGMHKR